MEIVIQGTYYDLIVGDSIWGEWKDKRVFQILNKEFNVVEAEGPNELQARLFFDYYEDQKKNFVETGSVPGFETPELPDFH